MNTTPYPIPFDTSLAYFSKFDKNAISYLHHTTPINPTINLTTDSCKTFDWLSNGERIKTLSLKTTVWYSFENRKKVLIKSNFGQLPQSIYLFQPLLYPLTVQTLPHSVLQWKNQVSTFKSGLVAPLQSLA